MTRDHIPAETKLALRKAAGFGCVMCGSPIYDYEHIDGYGETGHDIARMTVLCPEHHREKTAGRLPVSVVRAAAKDPHNRRYAFSRAHELFFDAPEFFVDYGTFSVRSSLADGQLGTGIMVDGSIVLGATVVEGRLSLEADLRDIDNRVMLRVIDGQMRLANDAWDITFAGTTLTVRSGPGEVVLRMKLHPPDRIEIETADFYSNHVQFLVGTKSAAGGIEIPATGFSMTGFTMEGAIAIAVGPIPAGHVAIFGIEAPRSFGGNPAPTWGTFAATTAAPSE